MNTYARAGQRLDGRFDLVYPYHYQPSDHASVWIARDVALSRQVRAIILDPNDPHTRAVIDAAHRASLVNEPHLVSIIHVINHECPAIITEIPPGNQLSERLGSPIPPEQVRAIVGEASSAIATGARRGVRHLQCSAKTIFLTGEGDIIVDGLGIYAVLAGANIAKDRATLDREEARNLTVLAACLLLGRDVPAGSTHDAVIEEALGLDLPPVLDSILRRELAGSGAPSPADLTRSLVPWPAIDVSSLPGGAAAAEGPGVSADPTQTMVFAEKVVVTPHWPALRPEEESDAVKEGGSEAEDAQRPEENSPENPADQPAATRDEAAQLVDDVLGVDNQAELLTPLTWPGFTPPQGVPEKQMDLVPDSDATIGQNRHDDVVQAPAPPAVQAPVRSAPPVPPTIPPVPPATPEASVTKPVVQPALSKYSAEREKKFEASRVVIALCAVGLLIFGWLGIRNLVKPLDPVTLTDPNARKTVTVEPTPTASPTPTTQAPVAKTPAKIVGAELVSPDAGLLRGTDPARQDNPKLVPLAVDGKPDTAWESWTYSAANMLSMSGIGLFVQLEKESTITEVTIDTVGNRGGNIQIRDTVKEAPSAGKILAEGPVKESTTFKLSEPLTTTGFIIWITELPLNRAGEPQIIVSELHVK
ncbi:hypothetical protein [Trueperella pyogenes]